MALIKCPECGKGISNKAAACVHCGCPISASTTTFGGFQMTSGGNKTFNEFFGENSSIQFSNAKYLKVEFQAVLSGAETESSRQSVFVHDLGRNVEFTVSNTIKVGQSVRVRISTERYDHILFVVASIARPGTRQTAYTRGATNQEAINLLKNYKPNLLVRFFKTVFLKNASVWPLYSLQPVVLVILTRRRSSFFQELVCSCFGSEASIPCQTSKVIAKSIISTKRSAKIPAI